MYNWSGFRVTPSEVVFVLHSHSTNDRLRTKARWARLVFLQQPKPKLVLQTDEIDNVTSVLGEVEGCCAKQQLFAVGFVSYEAASGFDDKLTTHTPGELPLVWFALFTHRDCIEQLPGTARALTGSWEMQEKPTDYAAHVTTLREHIGAGDVYQVNYTTRFKASGSLDLSSFVNMAWGAEYATFIDTPEFTIASASPELFFSKSNGRVISKPMKGTAARGLTLDDDARQHTWLKTSEKTALKT